MKKVVEYIRQQKDRQYLLNNIPNDVDKKAWEVIVRLSTRGNKKRKVKFISSKIVLLSQRRLKRNEDKYVKLSKDLSSTDKDLLDRHLKFVKGLFDYEKKRQENIEKKSLQLISQSSIIISIITLAIGTLSSKFISLDDYWFYSLVAMFSLILLYLFLTLYFSISSLKTKLYNRPAHTLMVSPDAKDEKRFIYEEATLLYNSVEDNIIVDDKKAIKMNKGYMCFKWAIVLITIFSSLTFYATFKLEKEKKLNITVQKVEIQNPSDISNIDQNMEKIKNKLNQISDTLNRRK